ncbi:MAG: DUF2231 domain-containing protein [Flavobacteriales bacterium]
MENLIPDWAPNIHPLLVHFPIAILITATLADFALVIWDKTWIRKTVLGLFTFGILMLVITYLSGKQAVDAVDIPLKAQHTASYHADWALKTLFFYGFYLMIRWVLNYAQYDRKRWVAILLFIVGMAGIGFIAKTADLGGHLVFGHGVGVHQTSNKNSITN